MNRKKENEKNKKRKNYLTESYNSREKNIEKERKRRKELERTREKDRKNYKANRNAYYEETLTSDEIRMKRREEERRNRKKTNIFEKLVIILALIAIGYLGYNTFKETNIGQQIEITVDSGTIEKVISGKAKIVRNEKVIYASTGGDVEYYYHEGEKVKNGSKICKIYSKEASKQMEEKIYELDEAIVKAQNKALNSTLKEELANVDEYIYGLIDEYLVYSNTNYSFDVYDLKEELESKFSIKRNIYLQNITDFSESYIANRNNYNNALEHNATNIFAPMGGVISYYVDGYEKNYTPENISELKGKYLQEGNSKLITSNKRTVVAKNDTICKIVDNTAWYITATLGLEETKNWTINDVKTLRVKNVSEDKIIGTIVNVLEYNKSNVVTFKITEQMNKYMSFRDIEIEVIETEIDGIKVPTSAIEVRDCIKVPKSSVIKKNGNYYVIKSENGVKKQQQINVAYTGDSGYYVLASDNSIGIGEYVIAKEQVKDEDGNVVEKEKQLIVGEIVKLEGVYKVVGTMHKYVVVNTLAANENYTIIEDAENSNLILHDKIILDVKAMDKE